MGYHGTENHLTTIFQTTLKRPNLFLSPQQEICNCKIEYFINVPGFICVYFKHQRFLTNAMMTFDKVCGGKNIKARIFFVNGRQVLSLDQNRRIMINGASMLVIESSL